jgi:putative PIN family toxin of toxin-antitoxin system
MASVVFDTVVFVRALLNRRSRWARLVFEHAADYRLVVSPPVVAEVIGVLGRRELAQRFTTLPGRNPAAVLAILTQATVVEVDMAAFPRVSRDAKDDMLLATAAAGAVDFIVSEDNDLPVLAEYEGVPIVDAATFLRGLDEQAATDARNGA